MKPMSRSRRTVTTALLLLFLLGPGCATTPGGAAEATRQASRPSTDALPAQTRLVVAFQSNDVRRLLGKLNQQFHDEMFRQLRGKPPARMVLQTFASGYWRHLLEEGPRPTGDWQPEQWIEEESTHMLAVTTAGRAHHKPDGEPGESSTRPIPEGLHARLLIASSDPPRLRESLETFCRHARTCRRLLRTSTTDRYLVVDGLLGGHASGESAGRRILEAIETAGAATPSDGKGPLAGSIPPAEGVDIYADLPGLWRLLAIWRAATLKDRPERARLAEARLRRLDYAERARFDRIAVTIEPVEDAIRAVLELTPLEPDRLASRRTGRDDRQTPPIPSLAEPLVEIAANLRLPDFASLSPFPTTLEAEEPEASLQAWRDHRQYSPRLVELLAWLQAPGASLERRDLAARQAGRFPVIDPEAPARRLRVRGQWNPTYQRGEQRPIAMEAGAATIATDRATPVGELAGALAELGPWLPPYDRLRTETTETGTRFDLSWSGRAPFASVVTPTDPPTFPKPGRLEARFALERIFAPVPLQQENVWDHQHPIHSLLSRPELLSLSAIQTPDSTAVALRLGPGEIAPPTGGDR